MNNDSENCWDKIPNEAPKNALYAWGYFDDIPGYDTAEYETIEGNKIEVSEVTSEKSPRLNRNNVNFLGFVTRCTRLAPDPYEDMINQFEDNIDEN